MGRLWGDMWRRSCTRWRTSVRAYATSPIPPYISLYLPTSPRHLGEGVRDEHGAAEQVEGLRRQLRGAEARSVEDGHLRELELVDGVDAVGDGRDGEREARDDHREQQQDDEQPEERGEQEGAHHDGALRVRVEGQTLHVLRLAVDRAADEAPEDVEVAVDVAWLGLGLGLGVGLTLWSLSPRPSPRHTLGVVDVLGEALLHHEEGAPSGEHHRDEQRGAHVPQVDDEHLHGEQLRPRLG